MIHTIVGTLDAADNWFNNPVAEVSAHYGVGQKGQIYQWVMTYNTAWANGPLKTNSNWLWPSVNPNRMTVSIETEGHPDDPVSTSMYEAVKWLCKETLQTHPTIIHLYAHSAISNTQCPGPRWTSGKLQQLAGELGLEVVI